MRLKTLWLVIFMIVLLALGGVLVGNVRGNTWEQVGEGVEYREFVFTDPPNHVFVARMARSNPNVTIESSIAQGRLNGGLEPVSAQASRYDDALNTWGGTWGQRNHVLVAINGFFFDTNGVPWSGQIQGGWYAKHFYESQSVAGFIWKLDRSAFIGECITHPPDKQYIDYTTGKTQSFDGINRARGDDGDGDGDDIVLYTPQYGDSTGTGNGGVEVLVEMDEPTFIALAREVPFGTVKQIRNGAGDTPIPFDAIVISAQGAPATKLLNNVHGGDRIGIAQKVKNCAISPDYDWEGAYAGIGADFYFLKNGVIQSFDNPEANSPDPRTAVAFNNQYIYFIVVDGRQEGYSEGMDMAQLGQFARDTLGATYGVTLDGGGSSTMVVNGKVVNHPSDRDLCHHVYLPLVMGGTADASKADLAEKGTVAYASPGACERWVANGLMMVEVLPPEYSHAYTPGKDVVTIRSTALRSGPGTNYHRMLTLPANVQMTLQDDGKGLAGVYAKGTYWWKVQVNQEFGWVDEADIVPVLNLRSSNFFKRHFLYKSK